MVRVEDSVVMNFKVDGLGFRRFKEVVGQYQRWFVYDLGASEVPGLAPLVAEYDGNGNLVAKYHYDGGGLIAMTRNNQSYWYGFEGIGTVRQLMGSQGQVVDAYAFDAWGNELTGPQSQVQNPFKYVGKHGYYLDTESALMLLGVRYYGAVSGLFLSRDLIEGYGYTYAADNPARWMDPQGLQPDSQHCNIINGQKECADTEDSQGWLLNPWLLNPKQCKIEITIIDAGPSYDYPDRIVDLHPYAAKECFKQVFGKNWEKEWKKRKRCKGFLYDSTVFSSSGITYTGKASCDDSWLKKPKGDRFFCDHCPGVTPPGGWEGGLTGAFKHVHCPRIGKCWPRLQDLPRQPTPIPGSINCGDKLTVIITLR
jgi:RHS repeat-associated protein